MGVRAVAGLVFVLSAMLCGAPPVFADADAPARPTIPPDAYRDGVELYRAGRFAEAEPLLEEALERSERDFGPEELATAEQLNGLGLLYDAQGRYAEAEVLLARALTIREAALGSSHREVARALNDLGALHRHQRRYSEAEALLERSLAIREATLGPDHPDTAESLCNLGTLRRRQGFDGEAESLLKRSLSVWERSLGPDHPDVAHGLASLSTLYRERGRLSEAEPLAERALAVRETALGPQHPDVAESLHDLGHLYRVQRRYAEAEPLLGRALVIREAVLGPDNTDVAESLESLGNLHRPRGRLAEAEAYFTRALTIKTGQFGPDHLDVAVLLLNIGGVHSDRGQLMEAEILFRRALAIEVKALGPDHADVAWTLRDLALLYGHLGRTDEAIDSIRRAARIWRVRLARGAKDPRDAGDPRAHVFFADHMAIATRLVANGGSGTSAGLLDEAFQAGQLARTTDTAAVVSRVAARFAANDDELARLVRGRQDLVERWHALDRAVLEATARPPATKGRPSADQLRRGLAQLDRQLDAVDGDLSSRFPEYRALASPEPVSLEEAQRLLGPDEALLAYLVAREPDGVHLAVVRHDRAKVFRLQLGSDELDKTVRRLRDQLDPGRMQGRASRFDTALAHALYRELFPVGPDLLAGARHLLIVPDGPLDSLPFSVLVRSGSGSQPTDVAGYRQVDWLARHYATTTLPSVSSLRALRRFAKPSRAGEPFRGIGDPLLDGHPGAAPRAGLASLFTTRGLADPVRLRALPALPETADELRTLAAQLGASDASVFLAGKATETAIKGGALRGARIVAFATHAGVAGELPGLAEPALVLTPPATASEADDGLLTASEAAQLELDADLVVLSACNTAAPDGTPGAPGLSGLAKAFIHAGSRSLLVSHWQVYSDVAVKLTTGMFAELSLEPGLGRAEALRRSMLATLNDKTRPDLAHPAAWAPFVVVGEGGSP